MALNQVDPIAVYDHATLPIRFILQPDGVHVYSEGKAELFLPAGDVGELAQAALAFYAPPPPPPPPPDPASAPAPV